MVLPLTAPEGELSITSILLKNPHEKRMKEIKEYASKLIMHNTGKGKDKFIEQMDYFEKKELCDLRKKYSPSNEDFFSRLHRPLDKVFNAKGGSVNYYISADNKPRLLDKLKDVHEGYALRKWVETFWLSSYNYDPMGLIFMEIGDGITYPTYKCSLEIYCYPPSRGRKLDYVVFDDNERTEAAKLKEGYGGEKYYRVVDDAYDYTIKWDGQTATEVKDATYPNFYKEVPAITVGNIYDTVKGYFVSPDDDIIDIADQFFRERSVLTMFEMHHGFPIRWMYKGVCPKCKGTGKISADPCTACNGSGNKSKYDVAETIAIPVPKTKDDAVLAPNIAGYVTPPVETWQEMVESIEKKYRDAHYSTWGTHQTEDSSNETATGRFIDVQPVNERLGKYSDAGEYIERWITDMIGEFYFESSYSGCEVNYGRRYLIESPDEIWQKYQEARKAGIASIGSLNNMLLQYIQSEYQSDSMEQVRQVKMMKLEPFVHMTIEQAKANVISPLDFCKKLYFGQWVNQLGENDLINKDFPTLNTMLTEYVQKLGVDAEMKKQQEMQFQGKQAA